ncbi:MAG: Gfo/Idh/MocA family oxidoreductase [Marinibacterium sp.]|nr:Gfo/Idh/MocA family oxidoreductase [Marinibacterium sp.]
MTRPLRYGIIGCGMMGQEHLRNIALLPDTQVAAIFEPDAAMRAHAAALAPGAAMVDSLDALLGVEALDALLIASPNHLHAAQLHHIAARRPLPLLVEKPLYTDPADATRITELEQQYPSMIWVAMEYRYMPPIAAFLDAASDATGGIKMLSIREHRFPFLEKVGDWNRFNRNTGGTLVEKCCHFFDLMRLVIGSEPCRISASGGQAVNHLDERYNGQTPDIWDHAYVIVDFVNGARAMLELCMFAEGAMYQENISAIGPKGKIEALVPGPGRFWPAHLGPAPEPRLILSPRNRHRIDRPIPVDATLLNAGDHNGSTFYQHRQFAAALRAGTPPEVSLHDGAAAVRMGLAAQQSATQARTITL